MWRPLPYIGRSPNRPSETRVNDPRLKKLKYRAWHRGIVEADLILGPFADRHLASLAPDELDQFEELLDQPDPDIFAWIVGTAEAPSQFDGPVLARIRDFRFSAHPAVGEGG